MTFTPIMHKLFGQFCPSFPLILIHLCLHMYRAPQNRGNFNLLDIRAHYIYTFLYNKAWMVLIDSVYKLYVVSFLLMYKYVFA